MSAPQPILADREIEIFESALAVPEAGRAAYVDQACGADGELLKRVRRRLAWEDRMKGFLLAPATEHGESDYPFHGGEIVAGRFEIVRQAGEGGMAVVYEALDRKAERRVAIKCPKLAFRRRLVPELRSALQVTHTNICRVHEVHTAETRFGAIDFLTMEYLDGETLGQRLSREPRPSLDEAEAIIAQVCAGMSEAHARGIVHGDLKPDNIILARTGSGVRAVITDFGLARLAPSMVTAGANASLRGTPDFLAPELWRGKPPSRETDIYALGVVMYELIAGKRPFAGVPVESRAGKAPRPLQESAADAPVSWNDPVFACLSARPEDRPRDAIHVAQALAAAHRSAGRLPLIAALLAAALALGSTPVSPSYSPPPPVARLAILPPQTDAASTAVANGIALDLSSRWKAASTGRPVVLIPLSTAIQYHVRSRENALGALGATHTLQFTAHRRGGRIEVGASLYDTVARRQVADRSGAYTDANLFEVRRELLSTINSALRSQVTERLTDLRSAGYFPYVQALYYLNGEPNPRKASELLEKGAEPDSPSVLLSRAEAAMAGYKRSHDPETLAKAVGLVDKVRELDPGGSAAVLFAAGVYEKAGQLGRAVQEYRTALASEPGNGAALRGLADALAAQGRSEEAIQAYVRAAEGEPGYFAPVLQSGLFYYRRGRYPEAERDWRRATELAPQLAKAHHNLAAVLTDTAQYAAAEAEFQQALNLERTAATMAGMGALLAYEGRHAESVYYYEMAVSLGPEDHLFISNLADAYRRTDRTAEALRTYAKALDAADRDLSTNPRDAYTRAFRAYILGRLGRIKRAESEIARVLMDAPFDMKVLRRAAILYEATGSRPKAFDVLRRVTPLVLSEIGRSPDMARLIRDPRFMELKAGN